MSVGASLDGSWGQVRDAVAGDADELFAVAASCEGAAPWSRAVWAQTLGSAREPGATRTVKVIESERGIAAFGVLQAIGVGSEAEGQIENLGVLADARRRGYGRNVCTALLRWAYARGVRVVRLEVRLRNVGAQALYAGMGFTEEGRRPGYYREPEDDAVLLSVDLGEWIQSGEDTPGPPLYNQ